MKQILFLVLLLSFPAHAKDSVMCTMDAKQCPDGSYVSRTDPNCEFASCPDMSSLNDSEPVPYETLTLKRTVDGDTFEASGRTIRIWGIDTPEKDESLYEESSLALQLFLEGAELSCKLIDVDRYKREVMRCFVNHADLGALMVKSGWAKDYKKYSGGFYQTEELFAKGEKLGIWK